MEKPDITAGEWEADNNFVGVRDGQKYINVARVFNSIQDTQAISAVPEMLDALICCTESLVDRVENKGLDPDRDYCIRKAKNALEKAGVKLNESAKQQSKSS